MPSGAATAGFCPLPQRFLSDDLRLPPPIHAAVDGSGGRDDRAENAGLAPNGLGRAPF
jgi:hypothetical protein